MYFGKYLEYFLGDADIRVFQLFVKEFGVFDDSFVFNQHLYCLYASEADFSGLAFHRGVYQYFHACFHLRKVTCHSALPCERFRLCDDAIYQIADCRREWFFFDDVVHDREKRIYNFSEGDVDVFLFIRLFAQLAADLEVFKRANDDLDHDVVPEAANYARVLVCEQLNELRQVVDSLR